LAQDKGVHLGIPNGGILEFSIKIITMPIYGKLYLQQDPIGGEEKWWMLPVCLPFWQAKTQLLNR
jgi:hypothetical protein